MGTIILCHVTVLLPHPPATIKDDYDDWRCVYSCIIKCTVALILFSFRIALTGPRLTQTSLGGRQKSVLTKFYCIFCTYTVVCHKSC